MAAPQILEKFPVFLKAPEAVKNYVIDWSAWLQQELGVIVDHQLKTPVGITKVTYEMAANQARFVLSGGTEGEDYVVTSQITTSNGIVEERSIIIRCQQT